MAENDGLIYGDTDAGFVVPTYADTQAWVGRRLRFYRGANIVLEPQSFWGAIRDGISDALNLGFQIAGAAHNMNVFSFARGANVDRILEPLGTKREAAKESTVDLTLYGSAGANIIAGSTVRSAQVATPFETLALAVIPAAPASLWVIEVASGFAVGTTFTLTVGALPAIVKVAGALDTASTIRDHFVTQVDALAQVASRSGGVNPAGTRWAAAIEDDGIGPFALTFTNTGGVVTFAFTAVRAAAEATDTGPVLAQATTLRQILTPSAGWAGVFNELDADMGADQESDPALKARHRDEIQAIGGSNPEAIRARVLKYGGVAYAKVYFNKTDVVVDGMLPHSIRVVVERLPGTTDQQIGQAIWDATSAGDNFNGTITTVALDNEGDPQEVKFDEVEPVYVWVHEYVEPGEKFPVIGEPYDGIRDDTVAWGNALGVGFDVDPFSMPINYYLADGTDRGVKSAEVQIAVTATPLPAPAFPGDYLPVGASAVIDKDQRAVFDTSRTTVEEAP